MERLTTEELDAIRARAEKATDGQPTDGNTPEWYVDDEYSDTVRDAWSGELIAQSITTIEDTEFIASSRTDVPRLLAEVERMKGLIGRLDALFDLSAGFISGETEEVCFEDASEINGVFAELKDVIRND